LLRRWLNRFVARVEPDETDERIRRSLADRFVSVRPDLDGVSFLSACLSSLDAVSVDLMLDALAGIAEPGDPRTKQQRRADVLVDMLMGRVSNGWRPADGDSAPSDGESAPDDGGEGGDCDCCPDARREGDGSPGGPAAPGATQEGQDSGADSGAGAVADGAGGVGPDPDRGWDEDDWDLPAAAFRPDPAARDASEPTEDDLTQKPTDGGSGDPAAGTRDDQAASGALRERFRGLAGTGRPPPRVSIGVVVSIQSLLGFTDTPGELADGSAHVPATLIRELAGQPGTLFYRLLTDPTGNLLDVTELGRFPSGRLAAAVRFRDGVCTNPICHASADRCDLDHVVPHPEGPTAGTNLDPKCRHDHRAKTHAGFTTTLTAGQATWTTPTHHEYTAPPDQLPVEEWPPDTG
jgi:hypothetical protein